MNINHNFKVIMFFTLLQLGRPLMFFSIPQVFNIIGVLFEIVAISWAARMIAYTFKKWNIEHLKHIARSDEEHFKEEKKQAIIILLISLGVLFQGIAAFF